MKQHQQEVPTLLFTFYIFAHFRRIYCLASFPSTWRGKWEIAFGATSKRRKTATTPEHLSSKNHHHHHSTLKRFFAWCCNVRKLFFASIVVLFWQTTEKWLEILLISSDLLPLEFGLCYFIIAFPAFVSCTTIVDDNLTECDISR